MDQTTRTTGDQGDVVAQTTEQDVSTTGTAASDVASGRRAPFVDRLSDHAQHVIQRVIGANRKPPRRLKSFLHGTWLGHPLHPAITDVPIGAWLLTAVLDVIWLIAPGSAAWAARGAEVTVAVGVVAALGAAVTGLADWSDTYGAERTVGLVHGTLNLLAAVLYIVSGVLRFSSGTGESVSGAVVGFVGLLAVLVAAYLGGDLVFGKGTNVNHTAWEAGSDTYEAVLPLTDLPDKTLRRVSVAGVPVVVLRDGEQVYAIAATCSHAGGPLDEGDLQGDVVQCPWHASRFCLRDGKVLTGPATFAQPRYAVRVRAGLLELKRETS